MSLHSLSALLAAILTFVIGWSVILRDRRHRRYVTFAILCFNVGFWYLTDFLATTVPASWSIWLSQLFAIAIPVTASRFFNAFLADDPRKPRPLPRAIWLGTIAGYTLLFIALFTPIHRSRLFTVPLLIFVMTALYHCIYLIYQRQRAMSDRPEALRLTYVLYGGAAAITLAAADFLPRMGVGWWTVGKVVTVVYMYFISQTLFHHRLLDAKELLGKIANLTALVLILTVVYGLLLAWVGSERPGIFFFNTVVASFVVLVLFDQLRTRVEDGLNRWMFAERYAFSLRLQQLSQALANIIEVRPLISRILTDLENSARVTHCSIYLADPGGARYRLAGHLGQRPIEELDTMTRRLFFERLRQQGMLNLETLELDLAHQVARDQEEAVVTRNIVATLQDQFSTVCIPLTSEDQLLGLLNLRDDRLREAYASDEIAQLRRVAAQAAITLRNSQIYEEMKERDRLAALGQMAAGLAHEIRNPLGAIKGAAQLLKPSDAKREADSDEFLEIIVEEVDRLDRVVTQFLGYARPDSGQREPLSVNEVLHKTLQLIRSQKAETIRLEVELAKELPPVRADPEQLHQVFLNLAINALQAMNDRGELRVSTGLRRGFKGRSSAESVEIRFEDTGKGIPADTISDIFIPFFTTKEGGTGLGLPICQRIIENHQGTIEVRSIPGAGSAFTIVLPAVERPKGNTAGPPTAAAR